MTTRTFLLMGLVVIMTSACSLRDAKEFLYTAGQVTYDSVKSFQDDQGKQPHQY